MGSSSNVALAGIQQQRKHLLVHHEAAHTATENMTQDTNLKMVYLAGNSKYTKQHAVGCEYVHCEVISQQLAVQCTAGICR
jgi:hypothetical protein